MGLSGPRITTYGAFHATLVQCFVNVGYGERKKMKLNINVMFV